MLDPLPRVSASALLRLFQLAWPIVLARASQSVIGFCDALMTAPLGEAPLAAVTTGSLNAFLAIILPTGIVSIVQSFTSQLRGRGDVAAVRRYAWYGLGFALLAQLLAMLLIPLLPLLLAAVTQDATVGGYMQTYLAIRLLSVGPAVAVEALGNWYGGLGNTRPALIAGVTSMLANVLGCYLLIEPRAGLPGYGVAGAAWASVVATCFGLLTIAVPFAWGWGTPPKPPRFQLFAREFWRVVRFGLPNGVNWFLEFAAFIFFIDVMVAHLGTTVLAAFNVVMQLNSVAFMPAFGLASAGAILVGESIGRRAFAECRRFVRLTLIAAAVWMMTVGSVYFWMPKPLMSLFVHPGPSLEVFLATGSLMLSFSAFWQLFDATGITLSEALRAAGDTTWCMIARVVLAWCVFIPGGWYFILQRGGGVPVVMSLMVCYILLLSLAFALRFLSGKWQNIDLLGEPEVLV
jgi:multidrug resistance protein, MATE family